METFNIMVYLHTSAGLITIDKELYVSVGSDDLEIERSLRSILKASQEYLVLDDAVTHKRCVIEPKNILFLSYDVELLSRKLANFRNKQAMEAEIKFSKKDLQSLLKAPLDSDYIGIGQVTYADTIPGSLKVVTPSAMTILSDASPDWLIKVEPK